jgi:hypothetical protein
MGVGVFSLLLFVPHFFLAKSVLPVLCFTIGALLEDKELVKSLTEKSELTSNISD